MTVIHYKNRPSRAVQRATRHCPDVRSQSVLNIPPDPGLALNAIVSSAAALPNTVSCWQAVLVLEMNSWIYLPGLYSVQVADISDSPVYAVALRRQLLRPFAFAGDPCSCRSRSYHLSRRSLRSEKYWPGIWRTAA